jgi:N-methylhydantoinase A
MEEAIKAISTMRGHDLRDFTLLAFGGAGPLHAGRIARDLGMAGVIVPLHPGVFSAIGLVMADVRHDYMRSRLSALEDTPPGEIDAMFENLSREARAELEHDGFAPDRIRVERALDLRYAGQGYEIAVPCGAQPFGTIGGKELRASFDRLHQSMFGHMAPDEVVEIVSYRMRGIGLVPPVAMPRFKPAGTSVASALRGRRRIRFNGEELDCPVYQRERLDVGAKLAGPAVLDQLDCTTLISPGQVARVDEWKNLLVSNA